ncbi:hypothetical protein ccrud_02100 [Corynebacterium crudilactis]|uniref:DNA-binding protein n=1 Tax=Corynebacterium crudilactis TaxID=1652495 RepID=A0A172QR17_9CORY|nr:hypothetical protein ccrud_02100 [Corynebacterium crudilactis]
MTDYSQVSGTAAPLHRALMAAGYPELESLNGVSYESLISLHGVGKVGLDRVQEALKELGMSLTFP